MNTVEPIVRELEEHWPEETPWTCPQGGLFLWARTSEAINTRGILEKAVAAKVAYVPGFAFHADEKGGEHAMRLKFSSANEERVNEDVYRLGLAMMQELVGYQGGWG